MEYQLSGCDNMDPTMRFHLLAMFQLSTTPGGASNRHVIVESLTCHQWRSEDTLFLERYGLHVVHIHAMRQHMGELERLFIDSFWQNNLLSFANVSFGKGYWGCGPPEKYTIHKVVLRRTLRNINIKCRNITIQRDIWLMISNLKLMISLVIGSSDDTEVLKLVEPRSHKGA